jgi:hypothetical protein
LVIPLSFLEEIKVPILELLVSLVHPFFLTFSQLYGLTFLLRVILVVWFRQFELFIFAPTNWSIFVPQIFRTKLEFMVVVVVTIICFIPMEPLAFEDSIIVVVELTIFRRRVISQALVLGHQVALAWKRLVLLFVSSIKLINC